MKFEVHRPHADRTAYAVVSPEVPVDADVLDAALAEHGAVLLERRCDDVDSFQQTTETVSTAFSTYLGAGGGFTFGPMARTSVADLPTVLTTTGPDQTQPIPLHGEMHYHPNPPEHIWFWCTVPPVRGGATTIGDGVLAAERLHPDALGWLESNRIAYHRCLADGDWQRTFGDIPRAELLTGLESSGLEASFTSDNTLETRCVRSALTTRGRATCFIANVLPAVLGEWLFERGQYTDGRDRPAMIVRAEHGGRVPAEVVRAITSACNDVTVPIAWGKGDVMLLDNHRVMHGRLGSPDPNRSIAVRLGSSLMHAEH